MAIGLRFWSSIITTPIAIRRWPNKEGPSNPGAGEGESKAIGTTFRSATEDFIEDGFRIGVEPISNGFRCIAYRVKG